MSTFNPDTFMSQSVSTASATKYIPVPEGEFPARIKDVKPAVTEKGKAYLRCQWVIDDESARVATSMPEPSVYQSIWLDVNDSGALESGPGKNVQLGKVREAVGQNQAGVPWFPGMLIGQVARVRVKHSIDKRDNETLQAEIAAVTKL